MQGTVKWFNNQKGYGFITSEGNDVFLHYSNIVMEGFKALEEGDAVSFELSTGDDGRERAINVTPIVTIKMIEDALKEDNLHLQTMKDGYGVKKYIVVDENNVIQTSEQGLSLQEVWDYLSDGKELLNDSMEYPCN